MKLNTVVGRTGQSNAPSLRYRGVIFDMDGTLADSQLDFPAIRLELGLGEGPLLEKLASLSPDERARCEAILHSHERRGAECATPFPSADQWIVRLDEFQIERGVLSRNSKSIVEVTLQRCGLLFDKFLGREDATVKPDPAGVLHLCEHWNLDPREVLVVGDYVYDVEAAERAGCDCALITHGRDWPFAGRALYRWESLAEGLAQFEKIFFSH